MGDEQVLESDFQPVALLEGYTNLPQALLKMAAEHVENGKTKWLTDSLTGETFTFADLDNYSRRIGSAFYKRGLRKGDIVIFMEIDVVKQPIFMTGVWRANGICRASYPEDDEETLFLRVKESRCGWIYCEPFHVAVCLRVAERIYWDVEVIVTCTPGPHLPQGCTSIYELLEDDGSELPEMDTTMKDTAVIMCTSGTTGSSKGAVISQGALLWQFITAAHGAPFLEDKVNLVFTKSTHISGVDIPFGSLILGHHFYFLTYISRERIFQVVDKLKPNFIFGFPTFLLMLVNDPDAADLDLNGLEYIAGAGAPVTAAVEAALMTLPNLKSVVNVYGLTECAPLVTSFDYDNHCPIADRPTGSMGKLVPGTSAKFLDVDTDAEMGPNEVGELCLKCPGLFKGYYKNPKSSQAAFTGPPDYYFKTGDVGYYDENGFIFLVDRAKDIFKYFNNHVSPTEIENVILAHPAIGEVCVIAIPDPDGGGHIPRAFCVKARHSHEDEDAEIPEDVSTEDILEYANSRLASYKHLRGGVYFVDELPKGKTGKVTRQLVEQIDVNELE